VNEKFVLVVGSDLRRDVECKKKRKDENFIPLNRMSGSLLADPLAYARLSVLGLIIPSPSCLEHVITES
jgi:hypothetical protein